MVLLLFFIAFTICYKKYRPNQPLPVFHYHLFNIVSGSMEDNLHIGDYIIVKKADNYQIGDVVTYQQDNHFITHRIVDINGDHITTKGDANNVTDDVISAQDIIGKVVYQGEPLNFIVRHKIFLVFVFVCGLFIYNWYEQKRDKNGKMILEKNQRRYA
ncbi:signal peptidase I [bacterium]|nr:signal peptidase I [bacterium]